MKNAVFFYFTALLSGFITGIFCDEKSSAETLEDTARVTLLNVFDKYLEEYWHNMSDHESTLPFLDNRDYVEELARTIVTHRRVLIVGGPRDSGKTTGLLFMAGAAKRVGYSIIDINLKGKARVVDVNVMMKVVAREFVDTLTRIEDYKCVITDLLACPAMSEQYWQALYDQIVIVIREPVKTITWISPITLLAIWTYIRRHVWKITPLVILLGLLFLFLLLFFYMPVHRVVYSVTLLREKIEQNDWVNMFCCLRMIKHCSPPGPLLIVRDVKILIPILWPICCHQCIL